MIQGTLVLVSVLGLVAPAWSQDETKPLASLQEAKRTKEGEKPATLGGAFDVRNAILLNLRGPANNSAGLTKAESDYYLALINFATEGANASSTASKLSKELQAQSVAPFVVKIETLLRPRNPVLADEVAERAAAASIVKDAQQGYAVYFEAVLSEVKRLSAQLKAKAEEEKYAITINVSQSREARQGRTYPGSVFELFNVSASDLALANNLTESNLKAAIKKLNDQIVADLEAAIRKEIDGPIEKLRAKLPNDAKVQNIIEQLKALNDLKNLSPQAAYTSAIKLLSDVGTLVSTVAEAADEVKAVKLALEKTLKALPTEFLSRIKQSTDLGSTSTVSEQTATEILSASGNSVKRIGPTGGSITPDFPLDLTNGDRVNVVVTSSPVSNPKAKSVILDQSSYAYSLGWTPVRTVTYVGYAQENSNRLKFAPTINFLFKNHTRNLAANRLGSVGLGVAWFPIGVDNGAGTSQQAGGIVASLLDDWVVVGYARNFTTNYNFLFAGLSVPIRF